MMSTVTTDEVIEPFPYDKIGPLETQASTTAATVGDATTQSPDDAGN